MIHDSSPAASAQPAARSRPSARRRARHPVLPVAEQLRDAPGHQVVARAGHELGDESVSLEAAVPVLVGGHARIPRRDHERRIRHDAVEAFARHRLEHAPEPELDAVDAVQLGVEPREHEGALRDVGRDDPPSPASGVQGLDAASGSEVERRVDRRRAAADR